VEKQKGKQCSIGQAGMSVRQCIKIFQKCCMQHTQETEEKPKEETLEIQHWHFILLSNQSVLNTFCFCSHRETVAKTFAF